MKVRLSQWTLLVVALCVTVGCHSFGRHNAPPPERLLGPGPGVNGPGPGVLPALPAPTFAGGGGMGMMGPQQGPSAQVIFVKPEGMQVRWDITGQGQFESMPLIMPARQEFAMGAIYRVKLTNIPGRDGVELYPSVEVGPASPRSEAFLAHNAIPIQFTEEDFDQVLTGNFVTKVIYLPDPDFQELALAGVETLVSTRLDPGVDPITEADRRGAILAIIRLGNKDLGSPGFNGEIAGDVMPASYNSPAPMQGMGAPLRAAQMNVPPAHIAGVTGPMYGMPISATPIGLPGPPHIPHGAPAGLKSHTIRNHTAMHLPAPTKSVDIHVKQQPGISYPQPASRVWILDQNVAPAPAYHQPAGDHHYMVP